MLSLIDYKWTWTDWMYVFAPFQIYLMIVAFLLVYGDHGSEKNVFKQFFKRISYSLEKYTGYAGWAMGGGLTGLLMLGTAAIGLYWDVGFHVDYGRDKALFTPSHTMIVLGLGGLVFAAVIAIIFATIDEAEVGLRIGFLRLPWTAITVGLFGLGGVAAFPLDALWHDTYGVDVTLWSPTHLQLVAGGALATIGVWLMLREDRHRQPTMLGRVIEITMLGAVLTGASAVQGEFDFGVPQFQVLYLPILIAAAAGLALVMGRIALGRFGALKTAFAFIVIRGTIAILVAGPFNETFPKFPLYLVAALCVDGVAELVGTDNRLRFALAAGAAAGTIGVLGDLVYLNAMSPVHASNSMLPKALLLSALAGVGAALLGAAVARPAGAREGTFQVPGVAALAGLVVLVGVLAYPLPRKVGNVAADIRLQPAAAGTTQRVVEVDLTPANAAKTATAFGLVSWQGGGRISTAFDEVSPGHYVSKRAMPVTGRWKTVIGLQKDDKVMAVPVYMPVDAEIGFPGVPAVDHHQVFERNTKWLLPESKSGVAWVANAAYAGVATVVTMWLFLYAWCAVRCVRDDDAEALAEDYAPWPSYSGSGHNGHSNGNGNGNGNGHAPGGPSVPARPTVGVGYTWPAPLTPPGS